MLKISKNQALTDIVSESNPITTEHPITGSAVTVRLWLFNSDAIRRFEDIVITPNDTTGTSEASWVSLAPDVSGAAGTFASSLSMADIADNSVGKPFWVKVTTSSVADVVNKSDIQLTISSRKYAV